MSMRTGKSGKRKMSDTPIVTYRVNYYDNKTGKLFAYHTADSYKMAVRQSDRTTKFSRARTEIVSYVSKQGPESSAKSEAL
jgi:hypothetical protein